MARDLHAHGTSPAYAPQDHRQTLALFATFFTAAAAAEAAEEPATEEPAAAATGGPAAGASAAAGGVSAAAAERLAALKLAAGAIAVDLHLHARVSEGAEAAGPACKQRRSQAGDGGLQGCAALPGGRRVPVSGRPQSCCARYPRPTNLAVLDLAHPPVPGQAEEGVLYPLLAQRCGGEGARLVAASAREHAEMDAELAAALRECEALAQGCSLGSPAPAAPAPAEPAALRPAAPGTEAAAESGPAAMAIESEGGGGGEAAVPPGGPAARRRALVQRMQALEQVCVLRVRFGGFPCCAA